MKLLDSVNGNCIFLMFMKNIIGRFIKIEDVVDQYNEIIHRFII